MSDFAKPVGVIIGAILVFIGSFLTWITVNTRFRTVSFTGTETTDGELTAVAAGIVLVAGLALLVRGRVQIVATVIALVAAAVATVVLVNDFVSTPGRQESAAGAIGVWLSAVAAGVVLVAGLTLLVRGRAQLAAAFVGLVAAGYATAVLANEYMDVRERIANTPSNQGSATVGLGVWVTGIGCLIAVAMSMWALRSALHSERAAI